MVNLSVNVYLLDAVHLHNTIFSAFNCLLVSIFVLSKNTWQQNTFSASLYGCAPSKLPLLYSSGEAAIANLGDQTMLSLWSVVFCIKGLFNSGACLLF